MVAKALSAKAALRDAMVAMLPEDGTPVLNRVMRVMLARKLVGMVQESRVSSGGRSRASAPATAGARKAK